MSVTFIDLIMTSTMWKSPTQFLSSALSKATLVDFICQVDGCDDISLMYGRFQ